MRAANSLLRKPVYEFGDFRLDIAERVLERAGRPLPLFPKALDVLIVLVENRGHIVEKEDLMRQVWSGLFVEDNNLAFNISVLRKMFGESSTAPRYIETVPKRGYRFIAEVSEVPDVDEAPEQTLHSEPTGVTPRQNRSKRVAAGIALILGAAGIAAYFLQRSPKLTDKSTIVLADFVNKTGDPVFDGTLRQGLTIELEQSPFLGLISEGRVRQTLRLMGQPADVPLTSEIARGICVRTGGAAVLEGSIATLGNQYVLGLVARNCSTGDVLYTAQAQSGRKEEVLDTLSQMAGTFRSRMGESLMTLRAHDTPLAEATTPSLEALKVYSAGWKVLSSSGSAPALPLFRRATEIDPKFAMAQAYLGRAYADMGESELAAESTRQAYQFQSRASDPERFFIAASYDMLVTGNLEKAQQMCELWARAYPREMNREMNPYGFLGGIIYPVLGRYESALQNAKRVADLDPDFAIAYNLLAVNYEALNRFDEAASTLMRASDRGLDLPDLLVDRYQIAFLRRDQTGMDQVVALAQQRPGAEDLIYSQEALRLAYCGRLQGARTKSQLAVDFAHQSGQREREALFATEAVLREAFFGNSAATKAGAMAVLRLSKARDVEYGAAFALAAAGDSSQAQVLMNDLERRFPEDTAVRFNYVPTLRGLIALKGGEPELAIQLLQTASPYELGTPPSSFLGFFGALYPIYVRGEAYLAAHQSANAAAEFQKILDHRGLVVSDSIGALARLQLGRALALGGNRSKARAAYEDFLTLWKDADSELPILKEAKKEFDKLR